MLYSVVITSEPDAAAVNEKGLFDVPLVASPITVDEEEAIPIEEVDVPSFVCGKDPIEVLSLCPWVRHIG